MMGMADTYSRATRNATIAAEMKTTPEIFIKKQWLR